MGIMIYDSRTIIITTNVFHTHWFVSLGTNSFKLMVDINILSWGINQNIIIVNRY